jgi:hypothetical protein
MVPILPVRSSAKMLQRPERDEGTLRSRVHALYGLEWCSNTFLVSLHPGTGFGRARCSFATSLVLSIVGRTGSLARRCSVLASTYRSPIALPPFAHLFFGQAEVVGRGCESQGALYLHEHDGPDLAFDSTPAVELEGFI